ncbi:MAG TPA: hypothetical protein VHJ78_13010 [Actinomycetota bacterium]|nr:hypothetical protein [Actinomycetota bacterium]
MWGRSKRESRISRLTERGRRSARYEKGRVSVGGALTGLMVALSSSFIFAVLTGAVLDSQGHDLHKVVRGETPWASPGAGTAFVLAVFLSFLWGGYTAGRMGGGSGAANGGLVPAIALLVVGGLLALRIGVQSADSFNFPFGVGNLPLDANFTPLGMAVVAGVAVALLAGGVWGGVLGARWHLKLTEEYETVYDTGTDSFGDLVGRPSRF